MAKKWISIDMRCGSSWSALIITPAVNSQAGRGAECFWKCSCTGGAIASRQAESADLIQAPSGVLMEAQTGTVDLSEGCGYQAEPGQHHEDHDSDPDL